MFNGIVGQEGALEILGSMLAADRVPGTLLFTGPNGVGKGETALELARRLLCERGPADACDSCSACERAGKLAHPDLHILFPFKAPPESSGPYSTWVESFIEHRELLARERYAPVVYEKGRGIVKALVDEARERLQESALEGGRKVCVILSAERLNRTTGNMLLKILEEPPEGVHFIMTTDRLSEMLPTIVSRASIVRFRRFKSDEITGYLRSTGADIGSLPHAVLEEGSIKTAKSYLFEGRAEIVGRAYELFESVATCDEGDIAGIVYPFLHSRDPREAEEVINGFAQYLRELLSYKAGTLDKTAHCSDCAKRLSLMTDAARLGTLTGLLENGLGMLDRNVSVPMILTPILYGIHDTFR